MGVSLIQRAARHAGRADRFLRDARREGQDAREVRLRDVVGVGLGDLLDVDAAHVAEDEDRLLGAAVPGDGDEVLLGDRALLLDQHRARLLALDHDGHDRLEVGRASSAVSANFTAPAFMRPPESTWLFSTTGPPISSQARCASSADFTTRPAPRGSPCLLKRAFDSYS